MDTFRKWWNKPKADDKSILARFYYADRALTAVASELDSFDGRAEPERCSRLVGRLRQGQDQVLAITNIIMDELLGEDRAPRAFRAKFPEEVLQESLAGQLWFGAECLAAGSSIMNREVESAAMRPLAKAVTKSLDHVRNLLREQCLRNKTPNSLTLNLDLNDAVTETLCESLKIFDRLFAEFELLYVSAMVQVKTKQEHEMQELICVLFSETLQRALRIGLLEQEQVDYFDPALMFSIPRLAIVAGLVIYNKGPLNMSMPADQLSEMFRPFRTLLIKIRDLLRTLNANELYQLEKLLCTNEDIHIIQAKETQFNDSAEAEVPAEQISNNCDDTDDDDEDDKLNASCNSSPSSGSSNISRSSSSSSTCTATGSDQELDRNVINSDSDNIPNRNNVIRSHDSGDSADQVVTSPSSPPISPQRAYLAVYDLSDARNDTAEATQPQMNIWTNSPMAPTTEPPSTRLSESDDKEEAPLVTADCASGYLIPNTNFGNLLQTTDTPLTDSFIASDDEYTQKFDRSISNVDVEGDGTVIMMNSTSTAVMDGTSNLAAIQAAFENAKLHPHDTVSCVQTTNAIAGSDRDTNREHARVARSSDSGIGTAENTSLDHTPDSEVTPVSVATSSGFINNDFSSERYDGEHLHRVKDLSQDYSTSSYDKNNEYQRNRYATETQTLKQQPKHYQSHHHSHTTHSRSQRDKCDRRSCSRKHHQSHSSNSSSASSASSASSRHSASHPPHHALSASSVSSHRTDYPSHSSGGHSSSSNTSGTVHLRRRSSRHASSRMTDEKISISSTSSVCSDGDQQEIALALRTSGRMKFKSTENLLHRLFVCIAGVADQLQTNFASDLRQILRSVFLMNMTPPTDESETKIPEKSKDYTSDLFEFRASENDVIQENEGGSNQSIYSAEEANPESDSVFEQSFGQTSSGNVSATDRQERSASLETEIRITTNRSNVERSRSLGEDTNANQTHPVSVVVTTSNNCRHQYMENAVNGSSNRSSSGSERTSSNAKDLRSSSTSSTNSQSPHSMNNSPTLSTTTTIILTTNSRLRLTENQQQNDQHLSSSVPRQSQILTEAPPRWIPDEEAAQCMACALSFTTFRRRHHCRNCGGVFCGVCSNSQAPLPKFGLNKAVRVCRNCFLLSVTNNSSTAT